MGGASFVGYAAVVWVLWSGGNRVIEESLSIGALTSFVLYTLVVAFSLGALAGLYTDFMKAIGATQRFLDSWSGFPSRTKRDVPSLQETKLSSSETWDLLTLRVLISKSYEISP